MTLTEGVNVDILYVLIFTYLHFTKVIKNNGKK